MDASVVIESKTASRRGREVVWDQHRRLTLRTTVALGHSDPRKSLREPPSDLQTCHQTCHFSVCAGARGAVKQTQPSSPDVPLGILSHEASTTSAVASAHYAHGLYKRFLMPIRRISLRSSA